MSDLKIEIGVNVRIAFIQLGYWKLKYGFIKWFTKKEPDFEFDMKFFTPFWRSKSKGVHLIGILKIVKVTWQ